MLRKLLLSMSLVLVVQVAHHAFAADKFVVTSHQDGARVAAGEPITIEGEHPVGVNDEVKCWAFCRDQFGGWYVQNPPVELTGETFEATNIRPGAGIIKIAFVVVDKSGHERLKSWVKQERFGKIEDDEVRALPGFREIGRLKIVVE
ncbi:MAG: hypothetical protein SFU86_23860 [Pirellulaceae bacterium]|nr:hypothetical protein [Pirellulaceae bacterium]